MQKEDFYKLEVEVEVLQTAMLVLYEHLQDSLPAASLEKMRASFEDQIEAYARMLDALRGPFAPHFEWLADARAPYEDLLSEKQAKPAGRPAEIRG